MIILFKVAMIILFPLTLYALIRILSKQSDQNVSGMSLAYLGCIMYFMMGIYFLLEAWK